MLKRAEIYKDGKLIAVTQAEVPDEPPTVDEVLAVLDIDSQAAVAETFPMLAAKIEDSRVARLKAARL